MQTLPLVPPPHRPEGPPRFLVVGLGLMGGSLALALRHFLPEAEVVGIEANPRRRQEAEGLKVVPEIRPGLEGVDPSQFDLVFLATPVSSIAPIIRTLAAQASQGAIFTDLGSVKGKIQRELADLAAPCYFVGGHPMTGSQLEGLEGADPFLYENAVYILSPTPETPEEVVAPIRRVIERIGGLIQSFDPDRHDRAVSTISHLPYLLACTMVDVLLEQHGPTGGDAAPIAAGSFRGATRVASCPAEVFRDILQSNAKALGEDLQVLIHHLEGYQAALKEEDSQFLVERFTRAQGFRRQLPSFQKGVLPGFPEAIIKAQDKPGFIGQVASLVGAARINIRDLEVLHSREAEGGTIRIAFESVEERKKALQILEIAGFVADQRD